MSASSDRAKQLLPVIEWLVIGCILSAVYLTGIGEVLYHPDESQWIATSHYLEIFVSGDTQSSAWQAYPWAVTQPPLTRYVIGIGRLAGGFSDDDLNLPWKFSQDQETNIAEGRMPEPALLWWSRLPMAVMAIFCGLILTYIARIIAGRPAGYLFLILL